MAKGSTVPRGPGWWQASDGLFYPPAPPKKEANPILGVFLGLLLVFCVGGCLFSLASPKVPTGPAATTTTSPPGGLAAASISLEPQTTVNRPTISMAEFDQIVDGMLYSSVVTIVGGEGEVSSTYSFGGSTTTLYSWDADPECSIVGNANVTITDGVVVGKAQLGLC